MKRFAFAQITNKGSQFKDRSMIRIRPTPEHVRPTTDHLRLRLGYAPTRIAVFRALQLGDLLVAVPFFRALRENFPSSHITLIGLPWAGDFVRRFGKFIDRFIEFPGHDALPERDHRAGDFRDFCRRVRREAFDVAIQLHGDGRITNQLTRSFGARLVCGFYPARSTCPDRGLFFPYPSGHEIDRNLQLLQRLGLTHIHQDLEFPLEDEDWEQYAAVRNAFEIENDYVCIHAGARYLSRRWPAERFAEAGDRLSGEGFTVVLTGARDEAPVVNSVSQGMRRPHINLAGQTTLGALAALLQRARLLITNDTGVSHVAAAVGAPSVVIVLGSDPQRWAPLNRLRHTAVYEAMDCRPCGHYVCPIGHPCATAISVERVMAAAHNQLSSTQLGGST